MQCNINISNIDDRTQQHQIRFLTTNINNIRVQSTREAFRVRELFCYYFNNN